ncbi:hypothetical protein K431DRAFT_284337 [Polychaeton citri CBS 116435]|uniref:Protein transport protein sec16 n=1 Tax=Polychaeton citri CBS 116435 TaxID=1314669 RepID=A0A9P4QBX2_9PEZI|nr:hypothetical protein K431DRAFT_284337 [Polychaeton citri CBS 116435]
MEDDDFPNFGNAYPAATTHSTTSASWNPALREEKRNLNLATETAAPAFDAQKEDDDDDFFDRYPKATPKKDVSPKQDLQTAEDQEDPYTTSPLKERKRSISVNHSIEVRSEPAPLNSVESAPITISEVEGPISRSGSGLIDSIDEQDDEDAVFGVEESAQQQDKHLEEVMPSAQLEKQLPSEGVQEIDHGLLDQHVNDIQSQAALYEHQSESTELEEAQVESEHAPLIQDEQPPPTPGLASRVQTGGLGTVSNTQTRVDPHPSLDRAFTSDFTDQPQAPLETAEPTVDEAWPAAGDDATFGDLLDQSSQTQHMRQSSYERPAAPMVQSRERSGTDLFDEAADAAIAQADAQGTDPSEALENIATVESMQESAGQSQDAAPKEQDLTAAWAAALDDDDDDVLVDEETHLDPSDLFGDDADDFLEDDFLAEELSHPPEPVRGRLDQYRPGQMPQRPQPYKAHSLNSPIARAAGTPDTGLFDLYGDSEPPNQPQQQQRRPLPATATSFADKSKGGYQSPYDLPMEVKPRRAHKPQAPTVASPHSVAPPRSSSFASSTGVPPSAPPQIPSLGSAGRSSSSHESVPPPGGPNGTTASAKSTPQMDSGFFADLPVSSKTRQRVHTPQQQSMVSTPPIASQFPPRVSSSTIDTPPMAIQPKPSAPPSIAQQQTQQAASGIMGVLHQPERQPMFPDQPQLASQPQQSIGTAPPASSRYSPSAQRQTPQGPMAPPPSNQRGFSPAPPITRSVSKTRYSPAPAAQPGVQKVTTASSQAVPVSIPNTLPTRTSQSFAPRTSSPLAHSIGKPQPEINKELPASPPQSISGFTNMSMSPERSEAPRQSKYAPQEKFAGASPGSSFGPPIRSRTQSPGSTMKQSSMSMTQMERPLSSGESASVSMFQAQAPTAKKGPVLPHRRQFSRDISFAAPQDERSQDPLQRWKGQPIFTWDASGKVLQSFPKQTPFYATGAGPSIKCMAGDIHVQEASTFMALDERTAKYPGPLAAKSKGKKKELLAWLEGKLEDLERETEQALLNFELSPEHKKRVEEKFVLWKLMKIFLEHDGTLEGNPKIEEEVRRILLPNLAQMNQVIDLQSPIPASVQGDVVDKASLMQLRQALFEGQRERAVWLAEEKKLWGHALIIASTMGPAIWKQIVQSFVRSNVKSLGSDAKSMATLYQVFAGNAEECVDELVPPSARAGFQMMSKSPGVTASNPLEGLDQWRETLSLVASNRTAQDGQSLISLGKLLTSYGRVEAAHSCFLFAKSFVKHSGADDTDADFVLLGGNHQSKDETLGADLDTILLTEIYEYACSLSTSASSLVYAPHLQAYKLIHAQELAAYGLKNKAQSYCQHIASAMSSSTRGSPYYHSTLTQEIAALDSFISQTPEHSGGLFSKPSMTKVSSGVGSWFNKFVAGEDAETSSSVSGAVASSEVGAEASGPFGGVPTNGATISRPASGMDMYANLGGGVSVPGRPTTTTAAFAPSSAPSRYVPGAPLTQAMSVTKPEQPAINRYAPAGSYAPRSRPSMDSVQFFQPELGNSLGVPSEPIRPSSSRSTSSRYAPIAQSGLVPRPEVERASSDYSVPFGESASRRGSGQSGLSNMSYEPKPILAEQQQASPFGSYQPSVPDKSMSPPQQTDPEEQQSSNPIFANGITPSFLEADPEGGDTYQPPSMGGYEPPTASNSYEPPAFQPYQPEPDSPETPSDKSAKPTKRGIMDDEDDELAKRAEALKKAQADREADEAFRKAAEADAARDGGKDNDKKGGWFGGWFAGKGKEGDLSGSGPIKAKLGEQSSFYYDEQLKKWVNKKGGTEAASASAPTPPPPRGPSSRVPSGTSSMGPPSGPPSRIASGTGLSGLAGGPSSRPPTSSGLSTVAQPPSRTGTPGTPAGAGANGEGFPVSGTPPAGPGLLSAGGPPSRPATSLSNASSIDDLLGPPGGSRRAGGAKGKKKGGRYVDVMAGQ